MDKDEGDKGTHAEKVGLEPGLSLGLMCVCSTAAVELESRANLIIRHQLDLTYAFMAEFKSVSQHVNAHVGGYPPLAMLFFRIFYQIFVTLLSKPRSPKYLH